MAHLLAPHPTPSFSLKQNYCELRKGSYTHLYKWENHSAKNLNSRPKLILEDCGIGGTHSTTLCPIVYMVTPTFIAECFPYDVPSDPESLGCLVVLVLVFFKKSKLRKTQKIIE